MKFKLLSIVLIFSSIINAVVDTVPQQEYYFVLLVNHDTQHKMAKFLLEDLKKCNFPEGPLRANIPAVEDFEIIGEGIYNKLQNNLVELEIFCIEDGIRYKTFNNEPVALKKCGFKVPGQPKLHYVFCIKEDIKNVSGHIVLRSELDILQKKECGIELSFSEQIDDIDLEISAGTKREDPEQPFLTKVENYARLIAVVLYIQYLKIKDYFGISSDIIDKGKSITKNKDESSKFKPNCDDCDE